MRKSTSSLVLVIAAVLLCVAGAIVSGILLQHHVVAQIGGDPLLQAVCRAAASFSCDDVIASRWGKLELNAGGQKIVIPTAMLGFAFFVTLASWYVAVGAPGNERRRLHLVPTLLSLAGLLAAAFFEYIMFFVLDKRCPLCIATHVATLLIFVMSMLLWWQPERSQVPAATCPPTDGTTGTGPRCGPVLTAVLLALLGSALGWFIYTAELSEGYAREYFARWQDYDQDTRLNYDRFLAQPRVDIPIDPEDAVWGPADAKHTVIVFSDFMCPACQAMDVTVLEPRRKEFPGEFRIVFKHFPLDKTCNPELKSTLHPGACAGAVAVEAVRLLKGNEAFWTMHDAMFHNPARFTTEFAFQEAAKLGIDRETYMKRIQTTSAWDHIKRNVAEGRKLGLDSTPALFCDGRPLKPWGDRHMWRYLLSDETLNAPASRPASSSPASRPPS